MPMPGLKKTAAGAAWLKEKTCCPSLLVNWRNTWAGFQRVNNVEHVWSLTSCQKLHPILWFNMKPWPWWCKALQMFYCWLHLLRLLQSSTREGDLRRLHSNFQVEEVANGWDSQGSSLGQTKSHEISGVLFAGLGSFLRTAWGRVEIQYSSVLVCSTILFQCWTEWSLLKLACEGECYSSRQGSTEWKCTTERSEKWFWAGCLAELVAKGEPNLDQLPSCERTLNAAQAAIVNGLFCQSGKGSGGTSRVLAEQHTFQTWTFDTLP